MKKNKLSFAMLTIGKTQESTATSTFKRYIGVGTSRILAVNPDKQTLDNLLGFESQNEPEYFGKDDRGESARITFIVATDPEQCNGIDIKNRLTFILRNHPVYNREHTKLQVIDKYGYSQWATIEDAKAGKQLLSASGNPLRIDTHYRAAYQGEPDLVDFLKIYLGVPSAFSYVNGKWVLSDKAEDAKFALDHIKDYFFGNVSEIKEAVALQPNNKIKLLYGVRTNDQGRQYQTIATRQGFFLRNAANAAAYENLQAELTDAKNAGSFANTEFKVAELAEYTVQPSDLSNPHVTDDPFAMPADNPWA